MVRADIQPKNYNTFIKDRDNRPFFLMSQSIIGVNFLLKLVRGLSGVFM